MTQTTAVPTFGQAVGEAQTALRAVIVDVLQEAGTTFERCGPEHACHPWSGVHATSYFASWRTGCRRTR